jgi:D-3-phosphoglycerate dehydrogenase
MPLDGDTKFKNLKKSYAKGVELRGKTIGIIGFGRIGREVAKIALGIGMKVIASDKFVGKATIKVEFYNGQFINVDIVTEPMKELLKHSDFITLHVPAQKDYVIGKKQLEMMKDGVGIVNAARGGVIDEVALIEALESGKVAFAGLDTFEEEPTPAIQVLMNTKISLTPHIGAATNEAQDRIGTELASQIISLLKSENK